MIMNLSEEERVALQVNLKTFLDFLKENCLPTALLELGRRFREWLKFKRVKKETMRVYFKRYSHQLGKMEQCMDLVQDADVNFRKLMKLVKLKMVEFDRVRIRPSAGGVTSEASVHTPRDRYFTSPNRGSPQRFSPPRQSPARSDDQPRRRLWSGRRVDEPGDDLEEGEEEEVREEDYFNEEGEEENEANEQDEEYVRPRRQEWTQQQQSEHRRLRSENVRRAFEHNPNSESHWVPHTAENQSIAGSDWSYTDDWGWYRKSLWGGEARKKELASWSEHGVSVKVQTKSEEMAKILAELQVTCPSKVDLIEKLSRLISNNWREESLPSILTGLRNLRS